MMADFHIDEANVDQWCGPDGATEFEFDGHMRALNANQFPFAQQGVAAVAEDKIELIPEEQWPDLISQKDREKSWLDDLVNDMKIPCKDQDGLGYCHGYGPVTALEVMRSLAGYKYVELSAESVAGRVTGWRNNGGDPEEDLQVLAKYGACPAADMDRAHSLNHKAWKSTWEQDAQNFKVEEFAAGRGDLWTLAGTCALRNICTSPWSDWWSHCYSGSYRLKNENRIIWRKDRNNWGANWGDNGFFWMKKGTQRGGGTPSGLVLLRVATPSGF
jgi:hypothetical protein